MICKCCGKKKTKKASAKRKEFVIPFSCKECGSIKIDYEPVRDVILLWAYPPPEKSAGGIVLVHDKYIGGSLAEELRPDKAVVMAFGPGFFDKKETRFIPMLEYEIGDIVRYNKDVPWKIDLEDSDGNKHNVTMCGMYDIWAIEN